MARKLTKKNTKVQKVVKKLKPVEMTTKGAAMATASTVAMPTGEYTEAVGRRKTASARVRVYKTAGDFVVNGKVVGAYFANITNAPMIYQQPFELTKTRGQFAVSVKVEGSGIRSQLDAVVHGIARALVSYNPEFRALLKPAGLLSRDDRMKETRKVGRGGKARRKRQSPKR